MLKTYFATFGLLILITTTALPKSPSPSPATNAPAVPITTAEVTTLPNGFTLIVDEDHSAPVASVQVWVQTGSIHEGDQLGAGLSHILEHMLFKGTGKRKRGEIDGSVQRLGGYINAYTSFDRTVYYIDIPSDGVSEAVDILCDVMMNATLPEDEYAKEQEVIRREFAMGFDDPARMSSRQLFETVFTESPYRHPVIGYPDVYDKLTREDVLRYYKERYVPNNMFMVVTGDVDAEAVRKQVEEFFADIPRKALKPLYLAEEPPQIGKRESHKDFPTELTRLNIAWPIPPVTHPDLPALDLLSSVIGGGASSPLYREIREDKGLAHSIDAGTYALANEGVFAVQAITDPENRDAVTNEALAIISRVKDQGVSEEELDRARKSLLASQLDALTTARGVASDLGSNWLLTRNLDFSKDYFDAINALEPADLQRVAREYLNEDTLNITSLNPPGTAAPASERTKREPRGLTVKTFTLPNGLRLVVRENPKLPLVTLTAVFKGGVLAETPETNGISTLLSRSILKGTTSRSAEEIALEIESVGGRISGESGNNSVSISTTVMKPDLELGMDILADVLINPTFPDNEVERERGVQLAAIKAENDQMTSVARNALREALFGQHPYGLRSSGNPAAVAKLTSAQVREFHDRIITARNGVLAVFGDVNAEEVYKLAQEAFAKLPEGTDAFTDLPVPARPTEDRTVVENQDKNQAIVMIGYQGVDLHSEDRVAMELIDTASSDLGSRFFNRIREELGLAYFVGTAQLMGPTPGMLVFYLGTDPAKVDKVRSEFKDEIANLAANGLTEDELSKAKKKLLGAEAIRDQSDAAMAQVVALDELFGLGTNYKEERRAAVEAITVEDTKRVANKYFGHPGSVETIVAPASSLPAASSTPSNAGNSSN